MESIADRNHHTMSDTLFFISYGIYLAAGILSSTFYFQYYNKEYNVEFSKRVMNNLKKLNNSVMNEILGIVEEEKSVKNSCTYRLFVL